MPASVFDEMGPVEYRLWWIVRALLAVMVIVTTGLAFGIALPAHLMADPDRPPATMATIGRGDVTVETTATSSQEPEVLPPAGTTTAPAG